MSFRATFAIDSEPLQELLNVEYKFDVPLNSHHRPIGRPRPQLIHLVISSHQNDSSFARYIWNWCARSSVKSGEITFYRQDNASALKTLSFASAYCVSYKEVFSADINQPMKLYFSISSAVSYLYGEDGFSTDWAEETEGDSGGSSGNSGSSSSSSSSTDSSPISSFNAAD